MKASKRINIVDKFTHHQQIEECCSPSLPNIVSQNFGQTFFVYQREKTLHPLLLNGDALTVLKSLPDEHIDFVMTSPPYWGKREYEKWWNRP